MDSYNSFVGGSFIIGILSIIIIITFFVMSYRLGKIKEGIEKLYKLESMKPDSMVKVKCDKCNKEFTSSIINKGKLVECPECKNPIKI